MDPDDLDHGDDFDPDPPRVRPWRMIVGSVIGVVATLLALWSWAVMRAVARAPEPQGSGAAVGQALGSVIAAVVLVVSAIVAMVAAATPITALAEARAAARAAQPLQPVAADDDRTPSG
jgi:NhaP-type Na+/H+ or K+/H+ antiporter